MKNGFFNRVRKYRVAENFLNAAAAASLLKSFSGFSGVFSTQASTPANGEIVILVHGLFHRAAIMRSFAAFLSAHGYTAICYDYSTTRDDYFGHAERFKTFLRRTLDGHPGCRLNIVTHSLGGILARLALADRNNPLPAGRFGRIVMLAPPHHGSDRARRCVEAAPRLTPLLVRTMQGLSNDGSSPIHSLPWPDGYAIGVIAGSFDSSVTIESTQVPGQADFLELSCGHSFMMFNPEVHRQVLHFLKRGEFDRSSRESGL